jgi:hypothetical protein
LLQSSALAAAPAPAPPRTLPGVPLGWGDATVGAAVELDRLAIFPIYARPDPELAGVISLETALARGQAEVRERKTVPAPGPQRASARARPIEQRIRQVQSNDVGGGATVGTLVIENRGGSPVLVIAGTVVKGGKQDRQIAQDFVIEPGKTVPVDAYCVEQGRWSATRKGEATGGNFTSTKMLAPRKVRKAGQYERNQGKVWKEVAEVNKARGKKGATGSLMNTYDDRDVRRAAEAKARRAERALARMSRQDALVGVAYAIDGVVRAARWFATPGLFAEHREKILTTAALEAQEPGTKRSGKTATPGDVRRFVSAARRAAVEERRDTAAANENEYRESSDAFGAEAIVHKKGKKRSVTVDVTSKLD